MIFPVTRGAGRWLRPSVILVLTTTVLCLSPGGAGAQDRPFPYEVTDRDWLLTPLSFAAGTLGLTKASQVDPVTVADIEALDRRDVNAIDRSTTDNWSVAWQDRSDHPRNILLAASALMSVGPSVLDGRWADAATIGVIFLEAASITAAITYFTKGMVARPRPYLYNTSFTPEERYAMSGPDDPGASQSFFSGHTSSAFAAAALLSTIYTDVHGRSTTSRVMWLSTLSLASLTAYGRVRGGVHFPTDVAAGAVVGVAVGYLVPAIHRVDADHGLTVSASPSGIHFRLPVGGR